MHRDLSLHAKTACTLWAARRRHSRLLITSASTFFFLFRFVSPAAPSPALVRFGSLLSAGVVGGGDAGTPVAEKETDRFRWSLSAIARK
jgi:hypothetical protein